jgi:hypothetical protein
VFDDYVNALQEVDVLQHIAFYRNHVRELAFAD